MTTDDLTQAIVEAGGNDVSDVVRCVVEPNGHIAVTLADRNASAADMALVKAQLQRIEQMLNPSSGYR